MSNRRWITIKIVVFYMFRLFLAVWNFTFAAIDFTHCDWFEFGFSLFAGLLTLTWAILTLCIERNKL